jgi:hypothetical protein
VGRVPSASQLRATKMGTWWNTSLPWMEAVQWENLHNSILRLDRQNWSAGLLTRRVGMCDACPHPGPLPRGEGETVAAYRKNQRLDSRRWLTNFENGAIAVPSPGERVRIRADVQPICGQVEPRWKCWRTGKRTIETGRVGDRRSGVGCGECYLKPPRWACMVNDQRTRTRLLAPEWML